MQITKLSFLSTQALGDNIFAVEEMLDIPIEQVFGTHKSRDKAFVNLIESDAVKKVSRDTWKIVKDITLDAANVVMRKGDFFRVRLDEQGDDSPIHFDLDATGVFVLSRDVFASLQTYTVLEPGQEQRVRMQFTFGGVPVVDAHLTSKFASMKLEPKDASNGIYELVLHTSMAPSDDILEIEVTGDSLRNTVYDAPVRITVREPVLTAVPVDMNLNSRQTKDLSWRLLMDGKPAIPGLAVSASAEDHLAVNTFSVAAGLYTVNVTAEDETGATKLHTSYDFGRGYTASLALDLTVKSAPSVFVTADTTILEANREQLVRFFVKQGSVPVPNAKYSTTDIRGPGVESVAKELITVDAAEGLYAYRVTTNHKGGPIAVRTNITIDGTKYPVFFDLTSKSTPVTAVALNTLPAADSAYLEFRVQQARLGGTVSLVGVLAKVFTVTGAPVIGVQGSVEAVGQGVYRLKVATNNLGGNVNVAATLTVDGEDHDVTFSTTADVLGKASLAYAGQPLTGEMKQPVPVTLTFEGAPYDLGAPTVIVTGGPLVEYGSLRRTGVGQYEISDVNVNGLGGVLNVNVIGKVKGYSQSMSVGVPVNSVSAVQVTDVTHFRPTTRGPLQFTAMRDGLPQPLKFSDAVLTGMGVASYDGIVEVLDESKGRYQVKNVVASAPTVQQSIGVSIPYTLRGYSYTLAFTSYTEAMKTLVVDTADVVLEGAKKTDYLLKFTIDDALVALESSNVTGSGPAFVSIDSPTLEFHEEGIYSVKGLLATEDRGSLNISGTVMIDGITYPINVTIRVKDAAPGVDNPDIPPGTDPGEIPGSGEDGQPGENDDLPYIGPVDGLLPEKVQTVFFKLAKKGQPVADATIANGTVTGAPIESFGGFVLHDAATGTYRIDVTTNGVGGYAEIKMDITIDGEVYPTTYRSYVQKGKVWALTSATTLLAAKSQSIPFDITYGDVSVPVPYYRHLNVSGPTVKSAKKDWESVNPGFKTNDVVLGTAAGDVDLTVEVSSNQINWTPLSKLFPVAQAAAPTVTVGPMIPANATAILTFTVKRYGAPLVAPVITDLTVAGAPVDSAALDLIKLANGKYGTTVTTNEVGGDIAVTFNVNDDGVIYPVTLTGSADIVRPWSASLVNSPVPEIPTNVDILSVYGGAPQELINPTAELIGDSVISPIGEVAMIYQDAATGTYRIPSVLLNNTSGPVTINIKGKVNNSDVETVLQTDIAALPELSVTVASSELPFQTTTNIEFTVQRGAHPSIFASSDVKDLTVTGQAIKSFTPTVVSMGGGLYRIAVVTNGLGGAVDVGFTVTLAGTDFPLSLSTTAAVEPPVTARSTNTMASNATGTNLDFQLMRGEIPCADSFVVKTVAITGKSVTSYPQTVLNVDVATGKYRMQVNTSAYSDAAGVTITATVRGEDVTLNFSAPIAAGVLPTVTLTADNFVQNLSTTGTLEFKQGATVITGVTLDSVEGPLDNATLSGTTLTGTPSVAGAHDLTINFVWKAAVYTGVVSINPISSSTEVPVDPENPSQPGDSSFAKLKAYVPNDVIFKMKQLDGSEYPAEATFTVSSAPFTVTTPLARQADGSFKLGLSYTGELAETPIIITATNGSVVVKHLLKLTVWFNLEARFSGTALLDSTQVSNLVQFDVYEKNHGSLKDVYTGVDADSLDVDAENPDDLVGFSTFQILAATKYRGTFFVSTQPVDLANLTFSFHWTSPLGRDYTIPGTFRVQKAVEATWVDPTLKGGDEGMIEFFLKSGVAPIPDAVDAVTTVNSGIITQAPHVIDAATGKYAMKVRPNGGTTTLAVTLKIKQAGLVSVIAAKSFAVAPGDFTASKTDGFDTLTRRFLLQYMGVTFAQGGTPVPVTINSIVATGAITSLKTNPSGSNGQYTWGVTPALDVEGIHLVFNVTIGGVGMVLEMDYPIEAPVTPTINWKTPVTWTKNVPVTAQFQIGINNANGEGVTGLAGTPYTLASIASDSPNLTFSNAVVDKIGSVITGWLSGTFTPTDAGSQDIYLKVNIYDAEQRCKATVNVQDSIDIVYEATTPLTTRKDNEVFFTLVPPAGVTLNPTEIPVLSTPPHPISGAITIVNGKYRMLVNPEAETLGNLTKGSITGGIIAGAPALPAKMRPAFSVARVGNQTETAGAAIESFVYGLADAGLVLGWDLSVALKNLRVTSSVPGALKTTPAAAMVPSGNTVYGTASTNLVDYAMITWTVDVLGRDTGYTYPDVSWTSVIHDSAVAVHVPPANPYLKGMTYDVHYKLTWLTSGNPVTMGMTAPADMKTIDAANGIYAVPNVVMNADTVTVTPKWSFENSRNVYTGTAFTINPVSALTSTLPAYQVAPNGSVTTTQYANLGVKVLPSAGLTGATIEGWSDNAVFVGGTKTITATQDNLYFIPVTLKAGSTTPVTGAWVPGAKPVSITFKKDGKTTSLDMNVSTYQNTIPVVSLFGITTLGGEFIVTPQAGLSVGTISVSVGPIESATLYGLDGNVITGIKGTSTYSTDGRIHLNMPDLTGIRNGAIVINLQNAGRNYQVNVGGGNITPVAVEKTEVIGSDVLPVKVPTTVKFSLIAPAGVTYANPSVSILENPWTTSGTLTSNGDGTYSITITPDAESFPKVIRLEVIQDGVTRLHGVKLSALDMTLITMKVTPTSDLLGTGNTGLINLYDKNGVKIPWDLSTNEKVLQRSSIKVTSLTPGVTVSAPTFQPQADTTGLGFTVVSTAPSAEYATIKIEAVVLSLDTGFSYPVTATMDLYKASTMTWDNTVIPYMGEETVLPFTMKYTASQAPVSNLTLASATMTAGSAVVDPTLVAIDAAAGKYGVKVTPSVATACTLSITVRIGSLVSVKSYSRTFTPIVGATATLGVMAGAARNIGIKLAGAAAGDKITAVSGGTIMDPITGSWTPTAGGVIFVPMPASERGKPANTNTTPTATDTVRVTFVRAGVTHTVSMGVTIYWSNIWVDQPELRADQTSFTTTVGGATASWTFAQCTFYNEAGTSLGTNGSTPTNHIGTTGDVTWSLKTKLAAQQNVTFQGTANNGFGTTIYYWTDPFTVLSAPGVAPTTLTWTGSTLNGIYIVEQDLADKVLTFTWEDGYPMKNVRLDTTQMPSVLTYAFKPRLADGTDYSKVLVPLTDGSDGKYVLKLRMNGDGVSTNYFGSGLAMPLYVFFEYSPDDAIKYDFTVKVS